MLCICGIAIVQEGEGKRLESAIPLHKLALVVKSMIQGAARLPFFSIITHLNLLPGYPDTLLQPNAMPHPLTLVSSLQ